MFNDNKIVLFQIVVMLCVLLIRQVYVLIYDFK
jgi:hypothetical protein